MPRPNLRKLPIAPVLALVDSYPTGRAMDDPEYGKQSLLAAVTGASRRAIVRWATDGIPYWAADELAVRLGCHPHDLWGPDWYAVDCALCGTAIHPDDDGDYSCEACAATLCPDCGIWTYRAEDGRQLHAARRPERCFA